MHRVPTHTARPGEAQLARRPRPSDISRLLTRHEGDNSMLRRTVLVIACALGGLALAPSDAAAQQAYGRQWGHSYNSTDWERFYHYPYIYYPQNFWGPDYYRSSESLYYRYPQEMRVPVYNKQWHNMYPEGHLYHVGHHFYLDTF